MMEQEIVIIPKTTRESIRVGLAECYGLDRVDIRIMVRKHDAITFTKEGISVPIRLLPDLIAGLQEAATVATSAGLLK